MESSRVNFNDCMQSEIKYFVQRLQFFQHCSILKGVGEKRLLTQYRNGQYLVDRIFEKQQNGIENRLKGKQENLFTDC